MNLRVQTLMPCLIFLISLYWHISFVSKGPVSVDCLELAVKSQLTLETGHLQYLYGPGYPLMVILGAIFIAVGKYLGFHDPVLAVNYTGVIFGSIAVLALYLFMRRIADTLTAMIASMMLLFNPIFLDVSSYGINHAPALCFFLLGLLSLVRFQDSERIPALLLAAVYFGLMGATRLQDFIFVVPAICALFIFGLKSNLKKDHQLQDFIVLSAAAAFVIALLHLPYLGANKNTYQHQLTIYWHTGLSANHPGLSTTHLKSIFAHLINAFGAVGMMCYGAGIVYAWTFNRRLLAFTVLWWAVALLFYGNFFSMVPGFLMGMAPRFLTIMLPAFIIPVSIVLAHFLKQKNKAFNAMALFSFLIIIFLPFKNTESTFVRRHHVDLISSFYQWVGQVTPPDAVIIGSDDEIFIKYYSQRMTLANPQGLRLTSGQLKDFQDQLNRILNDHHPVYITQIGLSAYDHDLELWNFMVGHYHLRWIGKRPLELWYQSPFSAQLHRFSLLKVENK